MQLISWADKLCSSLISYNSSYLTYPDKTFSHSIYSALDSLWKHMKVLNRVLLAMEKLQGTAAA